MEIAEAVGLTDFWSEEKFGQLINLTLAAGWNKREKEINIERDKKTETER